MPSGCSGGRRPVRSTRCRTRSAPRSSRDPSTSSSTSSSSRRWSSGRSRSARSSTPTSPSSTASTSSISTSPPSSCSSPRRWWSSRPVACCPGSTSSSSTRSCCASRSATSCWRACSSARRSRTRPRRWRGSSAAPTAAWPRTVGPEEPYRWMAPDPLERVRPDALRARLRCGSWRRRRSSSSTPTTWRRCGRACATRSSRCSACCPASEPMSFRALVSGAPHRLEVIVRFLAVLELYKQGMVDLTQFTNFGELMVRRLQDGETALDLASLDDWDESGSSASRRRRRDRPRRRRPPRGARGDDRDARRDDGRARRSSTRLAQDSLA